MMHTELTEIEETVLYWLCQVQAHLVALFHYQVHETKNQSCLFFLTIYILILQSDLMDILQIARCICSRNFILYFLLTSNLHCIAD